MFKTKAKRNTMSIVRNSVKSGSNMMVHRISDGMKYAARMGYMVGKYPALSMIVGRVQKKPVGTMAAVAGMGLAIYGIMNLMKNR